MKRDGVERAGFLEEMRRVRNHNELLLASLRFESGFIEPENVASEASPA
jgi:hypothetical protein